MIRFQITLIIHWLQNANWSVFLLRAYVATENLLPKEFLRGKGYVVQCLHLKFCLRTKEGGLFF